MGTVLFCFMAAGALAGAVIVAAEIAETRHRNKTKDRND